MRHETQIAIPQRRTGYHRSSHGISYRGSGGSSYRPDSNRKGMKPRTSIHIRLDRFPTGMSFSATGEYPHCEFHILADVRNKYQFDESLYESTGNVIFPNFHAVRVFAKKLND